MSEIVYADLDEIVFEKREKEYGAYAMRKRYNRLLERAALIAFILFLFATAFPKVIDWVWPEAEETIDEDLMMTTVNLSDLPPPPAPHSHRTGSSPDSGIHPPVRETVRRPRF